MTAPRIDFGRMPAVRWDVAAAAVMLAATVARVYVAVFSQFYEGDDEGFFLLASRHFSERGHLYSRAFASPYGPLSFLLHAGIHRLGVSIGTDYARWFALVMFVGTGIACGALVTRVTRSVTGFVVTPWLAFSYLLLSISEPVHPSLLIAFIVAVVAWAGVDQSSVHARIMGVCTACVLFTKINCGVFLAIPCTIWLSLPYLPSRLQRAATIGLPAVAAGFIGALTLPLIRQPWVQSFDVMFVAAVLTISMTLPRIELPRERVLPAAVSAFGVTAVVIMGVTVLTGTPVLQLVRATVFAPSKFASQWSVPFGWATGSVALAILSVPACAITCRLLDRPRILRSIATLRLAVGSVLLWQLFHYAWLTADGARYALSWGVAWLWLFIPTLGSSDGSGPRWWLALLVVFNSLQAYPVAGVQVVWGTFLIVPLWLSGIADAVSALAPAPWWNRLRARTVARAAIAAVFLASAATFLSQELSSHRYRSRHSLDLPDARRTRIDRDTQSAIKVMVRNAEAHADELFSLPGLWSFNLWSGVPAPPVPASAIWYVELDERDQLRWIDALAQAANPCLIVRKDLFDLFLQHGPGPRGPLYTWVQAHFERQFAVGQYQFWTRRGRSVAPLSVAWATNFGDRGADITMIVPPLAGMIDRIELRSVDDWDPATTTIRAGADMMVTPIDGSGQATAAESQATLPVRMTGVSRIVLHVKRLHAIAAGRMFVVLRDPAGAVLGELRESSTAAQDTL